MALAELLRASSPSREERMPTPAYVAFPTFRNFLLSLQADGIPSVVDKSVMANLSGGSQSHLNGALKFLQLVDNEQQPTNALVQLVRSVGTEHWPEVLRAVVCEAYADIVTDIDLEKATPHQLDKCFERLGLAGETIDKSVRFYLSALSEAKVTVSSHIAKRKPKYPRNKRTRGQGSGKVVFAESENVQTVVNPANDGADMNGMINYPIHFPGGRTGSILLPRNVTEADCEFIELTLPLIKMFAKSNANFTN